MLLALLTCTQERKASVKFWSFPPGDGYLWTRNPASRCYWLISPLKHATSGKINPTVPHKTLPLTSALCLPSYLSIHCYRRLILLRLPETKQCQVLFVPVCRLCKARLPRLVGKSFHHLCKYNDQPCNTTTTSCQWFQTFLGHQRRRLWERRNAYFLASVSTAYKW